MKVACTDQFYLLTYIYFHQNKVFLYLFLKPSVGITWNAGERGKGYGIAPHISKKG